MGSYDIQQYARELLENHQFEDLLIEIQRQEQLIHNCSDLVELLLFKVQTSEADPEVLSSSRNILHYLANNSPCDEILLNLLDNISSCQDSYQFLFIAELFAEILKRGHARNNIFLEWTLVAIDQYFINLNENEFNSVFESFMPVLGNLLVIFSKNRLLIAKICIFAINLLPLNNPTLCESIVRLICTVNPDPLMLSNDNKVIQSKHMSWFFYMTCINTSVLWRGVYSPFVIFTTSLQLSVPLLNIPELDFYSKGLEIVKNAVSYECEPLEQNSLLPYIKEILLSLISIMIYSDEEKCRKLALQCFKNLVSKFDFKSQYFMFAYIHTDLSHESSLSFMILNIKDNFNKCLNTTSRYSEYFQDDYLLSLLKVYFSYSPINFSTHASHILSLVNFLWYLQMLSNKGRINYPRLNAFYDEILKPLKKVVLKEKDNLNNCLSAEELVNLTENSTDYQKYKDMQYLRNTVEIIESVVNNLIEKVRRISQDKDDHRLKILTASLPLVNKYGWTKECLSEGAKTLNYPAVTHGIFPNGGFDLVFYFQQYCNTQLVKKLQETNCNSMNPQEIVNLAIKERLKMVTPYIEKWPQAMFILTQQNIQKSLSLFSCLIDDICYYSGDRSVDFNWYARRLAVGGIYKVTELHLVQDNSPEYDETWDFLKRRLNEAWTLEKYTSNGDYLSAASHMFKSSSATVSPCRNSHWKIFVRTGN